MIAYAKSFRETVAEKFERNAVLGQWNDGHWFFRDETSDECGYYETEEEAWIEYLKYCTYLNGNIDLDKFNT